MVQQPFVANIIGIPHIPSITEVNVRSGPGTNVDIKFKAPVGTSNLIVIDVQEDNEKRDLEGKIYQWFRLNFPQGDGWVRDDLIEISGDGTDVGYPVITMPLTAFSVVRDVTAIQPGEEIVGTATVQGQEPSPAVETPADVQLAVSAEPDVAAGDALAIAMIEGCKMRPGPGTGHEPVVARMTYLHSAKILDSAPGDDGKDFLWVKLSYQGKEGWTREDLLRYQGAFGTLGLSADDRYPSPAPKSRWVRDFDLDGSRIGHVHHGWDHSYNKGAPILGGPNGGKVIARAFCQRCGTQGASTLEKGYALGDSRVYRDQGWNFGYGHYIIVRYLSELLPESTRAELTNRGFEGAHLFVMYAHLQDMLVPSGQDLQPNQQIATMGNSGNSTGAHLHLEVRAHADADQTRWAAMKSGLMTPQVLFLR